MALADFDGIDQIEVNLEARDVVIAHCVDSGDIGSVLEGLGLGASHVDDTSEIGEPTDPRRERMALVFALVVNAGFFVGELAVGLVSRSMGLLGGSSVTNCETK